MIEETLKKCAALFAVSCIAFAAGADVFDWINNTEEKPVWENDANWLGGQYPANDKSDDSSAGWSMTNSVVYLTNEVPFVQTIRLTKGPDYWNGWKFGTIFADRYHRISGHSGATRRSIINDARGIESFWATRPDTSENSTADHGPTLIAHHDFTNAVPQWHAQNYQRVSARSDGTGGTVGAGKVFGAGLFRVGDDYGSNNTAGYFKSAGVNFDFAELQTGAEGHMRLMAYANVTLHGRTNTVPSIAAGAALHLDASKAATLDMADGKVTVWRDADGGSVSAAAIGSPVVGTSTNGLAVVQCPAGSAFRLPSAMAAREIFLVFRHLGAWNAKAPAFVGNSQGNKEFLRSAQVTTSRYQGLFAGGANAKHLEAGEVWYDGTRTLPFGLYNDFRRSLHVVSGALFDSTAPVEFIGAETETVNVGSIELAEVLIYTKELTSSERRDIHSYLRAKWQTPDVAADWDLGSFTKTAVKNGEGNLTVADGHVGIREIALPASQKTFTKCGDGELSVARLSPAGMNINVDGGSMSFRSEGPVEKKMAAEPTVWLDASQPETFVHDPTNATLVCKWNDPRGANHYGTTIYATNELNKGTIYGRSPKIVNDTPTGKTALDFGTYADYTQWTNNEMGDAGYMTISSAPFREGFMVVKSNDGTRFHTFSTGGWELFSSSASRFLDMTFCGSAVCGGYWTVNGNVCDGAAHPNLSGNTYYVVGMRPSGYWYGSMTKLGGGRKGGGDGAGGVTIAEVVYYDRILTPKERRDTEAYLMDKWLGAEHPAALAQSISIPSMAFADGVPAVIDTDVDMTIGRLEASGPVEKKGSGSVVIAEPFGRATSLGVDGGSLDLSMRPQVIDSAVLHLDASKTNYFDFAVGGEEGEIAAWRDCCGRTNYYAKSEYTYTSSKGVTVSLTNGVLRKTVDGTTGLLAGSHYVTFGAAHQVAADTPVDGGGMRFVKSNGSYANISNVREMHYVFRRTQVKNNPIVGSDQLAANRIVPAGSDSPGNMFWSTCTIPVNSPKKLDTDSWHSNNRWLSSGKNPDVTQFYVGVIAFTNSVIVNSIALDRNISCGWGGIDLCELIIYTGNTNTLADTELIHSWLLNKWKGVGDVSSLPVELDGLSVTGGGSLAVDVGTDCMQPASLSLDVVFDSAGGCTHNTVAGKMELPASGTVRVFSKGGASPAPGDYAVLTAGALSGSVGGWTFDVSAMSTARRYSLFVRGDSLILRVTQPGTFILLK
jgi:hypothetical protein